MGKEDDSVKLHELNKKETLEKIYSLGDEENSFWAWEKLTKKNKGTSAYKARYLR